MEQKINIPQNLKPLCADDVFVDQKIRVHVQKNENGETIKKIGKVNLLFVDQETKTAISRIVLDPYTALKLGELLQMNMKQMIEEMDSNVIPDHIKKQMEQEQKPQKSTYIG